MTLDLRTQPTARSPRRIQLTACVAAMTCLLVAIIGIPAPVAQATALRSTRHAMNGDQHLAPGTFLAVGYDFNIPGRHSQSTIAVDDAAVNFDAVCGSSPTVIPVHVPLPGGQYVVDADDNTWIPAADQSDPRAYQATIAVPDICKGADLSIRTGGTITADVRSSRSLSEVNLRWHDRAAAAGGTWSRTYGVVPSKDALPAGLGDPYDPNSTATAATGQIVVKIDKAAGYSIGNVTAAFPVAVVSGGIASRGIYLVRSTDRTTQAVARIRALAKRISDSPGVVYAEPNLDVRLAASQLHAWPYGMPTLGKQSNWATQPATSWLGLDNAHRLSSGSRVTVAVLDTGIDAGQPVFAKTAIAAGWNYVDDNADVSDAVNDAAHQAGGHGTFVAGLVHLVAPNATILPEKVLDASGRGTIYAVAEAIDEAVSDGAKIINLSCGLSTPVHSKLLFDAIHDARSSGVVVVAAAGNDADNHPHLPASDPDTLSVAASSATALSLASFSDWGGWVDVAAPGDDIIGPVPGGFATWSGTSMAAPLVAGQAALLFAASPGAGEVRVATAIESTARRLPVKRVRFGDVSLVASINYIRTHR